MATLYVRNVPEELKARLEVAARENQTSLNREALQALEQGTARRQSRAEAVAEIKANRPTIKGIDFAALIREGREERELRG